MGECVIGLQGECRREMPHGFGRLTLHQLRVSEIVVGRR
jgi:hypothetical protein